MHTTIQPAILYFGTPVVLISSLNEDGSTNISPMSSAWWLGWSCMLGLDASSKTSENLLRHKACVLNLASTDNASQVNQLALLSASDPLPLHKQMLGYRFSRNKFADSGFTPQTIKNVSENVSENLSNKIPAIVKPQRIQECPIQLEASVQNCHSFAKHDSHLAIAACAFEVRIEAVHIEAELLDETHPQRIDPDKWRPLIMSFRQFYGLSGQIHPSRLGETPEEMYAPRKSR